MNYLKILILSLTATAATESDDDWVHAELRYSSTDRLTPVRLDLTIFRNLSNSLRRNNTFRTRLLKT